MYLHANFCCSRSYRNGDINSYINSSMDTLEKAVLIALILHTAKFFKSGILKSQIQLAEKQEEEEHRQSQSIMLLMQTQKYSYQPLWVYDANGAKLLHLIINKASGCIEECNGNQYLILVPTDHSKGKLQKG